MTNKTIPIFFTIDNGYAPFLAVAITSLIKNANPNYLYKIHVIYENVTEDNLTKIKNLGNEYCEIICQEMPTKIEGLNKNAGTLLRADYFTLTIYFRIFLPKLFPQYDKAIYLDSDIVIPGDISEFYNTDLEGNLIGGVVDSSVQDVPEITHFFAEGVGVPADHYINSGVLLMDFKKLRELKFDEKFLYLLNKYHVDCIAPDQDYINALCKDQIKYFPLKWNTMPNNIQEEKTEKPSLIHYNLFYKPWHYDVTYGNYFWKYAEETDYYELLKQIKANYTEEDKLADQEHLQQLIESGITFLNREYTFKKIFESGLETRLVKEK